MHSLSFAIEWGIILQKGKKDIMLTMNDEFYMQLAIDEAWKYQLLTYPNPAVGALVVQNGAVLSIEAHQRAGTSHAEVLALVRAYEKISGTQVEFDPLDAYAAHDFLRSLPDGYFAECEIYVTLEPCAHEGKTPSCASLLSYLRLKRVIIGTLDPVPRHTGGALMLDNVETGLLEEKCQVLTEPFRMWDKRQPFVLFKIAQTHNGRIGGGIISSEESRRHVHQLRSVCRRLIVGGNTVRTDRPILDARLIDGKAPDVTILSHDPSPDLSIPLFRVPGRSVEISRSIEWHRCQGFILVEGGGQLLDQMSDQVNWLLTYQAPKLSEEQLSYNTPMNLEYLHTSRIGGDIMIWSRNLGN